MEIAILVFGIIAAVAAVAGFVVPLLLGRPRLAMRFTGFTLDEGVAVTFDVSVHNKGLRTIPSLELYALGPGQVLHKSIHFGTLDLAGDEYRMLEFGWPIDRFDPDAEDPWPVLKVPITVIAAWGGKTHKMLSLPVGSIGNYMVAEARGPQRRAPLWLRRAVVRLKRLGS